MRSVTLRSVSVAVLALTLCAGPANDARAQLPVSLRLSALGASQQAEVTASAAGNELGTESSTVYGVGAEIEVGLPIGLHLGAHYLRHFGDLSDQFTGGNDAVKFGLGANEIGVFAEKQFALIPMSPVKPYLGGGLGYGRISLAQELEAGSVSVGDLEGEVDVYRVYALGGLSLFGGLGVKARAGYLFGSLDGDDLSFGQEFTLPGGEEVSFELDYSGFYASLAVSLLGF